MIISNVFVFTWRWVSALRQINVYLVYMRTYFAGECCECKYTEENNTNKYVL